MPAAMVLPDKFGQQCCCWPVSISRPAQVKEMQQGDDKVPTNGQILTRIFMQEMCVAVTDILNA